MLKLDPVERHLFLEGIFLKYGYDFRQYAQSSLDRRLSAILEGSSQKSLLNVLQNILSDEYYFKSVLPRLTIGTTEFFRDVDFFKVLRDQVFPVLKTYPSIKIWVAGCSTGEELISICILLKEAKLLERTNIYATDINPESLKIAQKAIYDTSVMKQFIKSYNLVSGKTSPSEYYSVDYGLAQFDRSLIKNVFFMEHNMTTDSVFDQVNLILCRNVLIYFNRKLQERVFNLFLASLENQGFLGIGSKESLRLSSCSKFYDGINEKLNIFQMKPTYHLNLPIGHLHEY